MKESVEQTPSLPNRAIKGMTWVAIEKWGSRLMSLAVFSVLGRILAPSDFGLAALALSISSILAVFVENGMTQALVQKGKLAEEDTYSSFWTSIAISLVLYGMLALSAPLLASAFQQPELATIIPVSGLVLPLAAMSSIPAALLERDFKFSSLARRQLGGALVGMSVAVTLAVMGKGVWAIVIQPVAAGAASTVILWVTTKWRPKIAYSMAAIQGIWKFSAQAVCIEFLNALQSNVDKLIIGVFFSPSALGYYYVGQRILTIVMDVIASTLAKVSLTTFSRLQEDRQRLMHYFLTLTFVSSTIAVAIFTVLVTFGYPITEIFFGKGWESSVPLMALMAPSAMLASVTLFDKSLLLATGNGGASLKVALGQLAFGTVVLLAATPFGITGVAAARSLRQFAFWPVRIATLHTNIGLRRQTYLKQFAAPILGGMGVVAVGGLLQRTPWADAPYSVVTFLFPAVGISLLCYCGIVWIFARRQIMQIRHTLRAVLAQRKQ